MFEPETEPEHEHESEPEPEHETEFEPESPSITLSLSLIMNTCRHQAVPLRERINLNLGMMSLSMKPHSKREPEHA